MDLDGKAFWAILTVIVIPFGKDFMQTHNIFYDLALNIIGNIVVSLLTQFLTDIL